MGQFLDAMTVRLGGSSKLLILGAVAIIIALIFAASTRYEVEVRQNVVVRFDRWTGEIEACDANGCIKMDGPYRPPAPDPSPSPSATENPGPSPISITLYDGTELIFPGGTSQARIKAVTERATACKRSLGEYQFEESKECARPTVDEQIKGLGYEVRF